MKSFNKLIQGIFHHKKEEKFPQRDNPVSIQTGKNSRRELIKNLAVFPIVGVPMFNIAKKTGWTSFAENNLKTGDDAGYDFAKFVLLTSTYHQPYTIAVGPQTLYKSIADLKKAGKPIPFCNEGGSLSLAYIVIAAKEMGFPYRLIPGYPGAPAATAGMLRGDCEAVSYGLEFTNRYLKEGVRPIAVHGSERHELWPNVPTSKEQGYPLELKIDMVFYLPPGSSAELAELLRDALTKLYQNKEFLDAIRAAKFTPTFAGTKQTQRFVSELTKLYSKYASELREAEAKIK